MVAINRDALNMFSLTFRSDRKEDGTVFVDEKLPDHFKAREVKDMYIFNALKIAQWIPIISIIASAIFFWLFKEDIFEDPTKGLHIAVITRMALSIVAPILLPFDIVGTILNRGLKAHDYCRQRKDELGGQIA
jgi:hypothetical protein